MRCRFSTSLLVATFTFGAGPSAFAQPADTAAADDVVEVVDAGAVDSAADDVDSAEEARKVAAAAAKAAELPPALDPAIDPNVDPAGVPVTEPMTTTGDLIVTFLKTIAMLGVVLAFAWLTLAKGMGKLVEKAQAGKRIKVVERIALDARHSLFLVDIDGKKVVLAGGDVKKIGTLEELTGTNSNGRFAEVLSNTPPPPPTNSGPAETP